MQNFIVTLLICSITMSSLALVYMVVTPFLAKRYSVTSRYYAWLILVIGLIIPFRPQFKDAIVKVELPHSTAMPNIQVWNGVPITAPLENAHQSALPTLWQTATVIWFVGMILFLVYHGIKHYRFLKLVARWSKSISDEQALTLFYDLKDEMGFTKKNWVAAL